MTKTNFSAVYFSRGGNTRKVAQAIAEELGVSPVDVKMSKPNPEIVIKSCKLLNLKPKEVILVGDTKSDVEAGRAAGCKVIGINVDADYTVKNISELTKLLFF